MSSIAICEKLKLKRLPASIVTYLFCSPSFDGELRCLPRDGGYLDQDFKDMIDFRIIEGRIHDWKKREYEKKVNKQKTTPQGRGNVRSVVVQEKDL
jgi:hypothetical protein